MKTVVRDTLLMLEDDPERLARFAPAARSAAPGLRLLVWSNARAMVAELEPLLPFARLIALDHDLEPGPDGVDPGDGLDVAKWLAARPPACPVVIHTSNARRGDAMEGELDLGGWTYRRVGPLGDDWIEVDWYRLVRKLLRRANKLGPPG